jgi:hypothetical protein
VESQSAGNRTKIDGRKRARLAPAADAWSTTPE